MSRKYTNACVPPACLPVPSTRTTAWGQARFDTIAHQELSHTGIGPAALEDTVARREVTARTATRRQLDLEDAVKPEHFEVLIVGAGLSGIGAACHLRKKCPRRDFAILEARDCIGGTWDLFRYPGVRSDSDMFTLGYSFRPWTETQVYRRRTVDPAIRPRDGARARHRSQDPLQTPRDRRAPGPRRRRAGSCEAERGAPAEPLALVLQLPDHVQRLLQLCRGLHAGFRWHRAVSKGASCTLRTGPTTSTTPGKRVVVIGSGATAVTLRARARQVGGARHACCSARPLMSPRGPTKIAWPTPCAAGLPAQGGLRYRPLEERGGGHVLLRNLQTQS